MVFYEMKSSQYLEGLFEGNHGWYTLSGNYLEFLHLCFNTNGPATSKFLFAQKMVNCDLKPPQPLIFPVNFKEFQLETN